jgi:hypothetical protein
VAGRGSWTGLTAMEESMTEESGTERVISVRPVGEMSPARDPKMA